MSPRATFLLTLLGVLLVGIPLPLLTRKVERTAAVPAAEGMAETEIAYATISFTGNPSSIRLRHCGGEWMELDTSLNQYEMELALPKQPSIEVEIQAAWENSGVQAVSLTLEPMRRESIMKTLWKEEGSPALHDVMIFTW